MVQTWFLLAPCRRFSILSQQSGTLYQGLSRFVLPARQRLRGHLRHILLVWMPA